MSFSVTRTPIEPAIVRSQHAWRLKATVTSQVTGLPSEVFVYHILTPGNDLDEIFECVASLSQLSEIGLDPQMSGSQVVPYYRREDLVMDCRSAEEALDVWQKIREDIADLSRNFEASEDLDETVTEVIP